jgi:hypothetical protein
VPCFASFSCIFGILATEVSLIFGLLASTLFTLFVIPVVYWLLYANKPGHGMPQSALEQEELPIEPAIVQQASEVHAGAH